MQSSGCSTPPLILDVLKVKQKNRILLSVFGVAFISTVVVLILGRNPILVITEAVTI